VYIEPKLATKCWVGFIDWLDGFIDMQAHVLNAFATASVMTISLLPGLGSS